MNRMKAKKERLRMMRDGKPPVTPVEAPKVSEESVVVEAQESVSDAPVAASEEKPAPKRKPRKKKVVSDD